MYAKYWAQHAPYDSALVNDMLHLSGHAHGAIDLYAHMSHPGLPLHFLSSEFQLRWHDTLLAGQDTAIGTCLVVLRRGWVVSPKSRLRLQQRSCDPQGTTLLSARSQAGFRCFD
ncbi:hypothetical protein EVAR_7651_1 [Eumeta japonica]|uniref:Uncharacterized protein n=1 Tax=Eumeta variegata TaxID=151549 RepID=A0A4C1TJC5_EUMVA|nr:hypothetical protein EVAR_7651_1 [Eumeta japonica]